VSVSVYAYPYAGESCVASDGAVLSLPPHNMWPGRTPWWIGLVLSQVWGTHARVTTQTDPPQESFRQRSLAKKKLKKKLKKPSLVVCRFGCEPPATATQVELHPVEWCGCDGAVRRGTHLRCRGEHTPGCTQRCALHTLSMSLHGGHASGSQPLP
jgi:hypothetical protein